MEISALRELLELLREYGVMKYACGDLSLDLGGSIKVIKSSTGASDDDSEKLPPPAPLDPKLQATFNRLPQHYRDTFVLGNS